MGLEAVHCDFGLVLPLPVFGRAMDLALSMLSRMATEEEDAHEKLTPLIPLKSKATILPVGRSGSISGAKSTSLPMHVGNPTNDMYVLIDESISCTSCTDCIIPSHGCPRSIPDLG